MNRAAWGSYLLTNEDPGVSSHHRDTLVSSLPQSYPYFLALYLYLKN